MKTFTPFLVLLLVVMGLTSCSDKNSLRNYFLDHAEQAGFSSSTIPVSLLKQEGMQLTDKQEEAIEAVDRVNLLFYRIDKTKQETYETEKSNIKAILKQKKYEELINMGRNGVIKYVGTDDSIDEIIVFLSDKEMGFAVTRIIGDDMTLEKFMELYKMSEQRNTPLNFDLGNLSNLMSSN
ncbi:DUF4252 domain-containing protein [uncultured Kordia sp.]|uniref:DUF4252 domain-containing protein n=1 Tax=uncultured Kordia sp. TaxID=507699 RepID=UPI00262022CD|nr:DUF4252 domain-containing protein [uncultured Kordia sp.]